MSLGRRGETFSQVAEENKGTSVSRAVTPGPLSATAERLTKSWIV